MKLLRTLFLHVIWILPWHSIQADSICFFKSSKGAWHMVEGKDKVPVQYRRDADCRAGKQLLAMMSPSELELKGPRREQKFRSQFGQVHIRWPRAVESHFGKSPDRAVIASFRTLEKALQQNSFSSEVRHLDVDWEIVFLDRELPPGQLPVTLVTSCHPAWMVPPARVYVVAPRVAIGCQGVKLNASEADDRLHEVLLHEMGHVLEYVMLRGKGRVNRKRSEGFATWFELFASAYSPHISQTSIARRYNQRLKQAGSFEYAVYPFGGTEIDYIRAATVFHALVDRKGIAGLRDVYQVMFSKSLPFMGALKDVAGWNRTKVQREVADVRFR